MTNSKQKEDSKDEEQKTISLIEFCCDRENRMRFFMIVIAPILVVLSAVSDRSPEIEYAGYVLALISLYFFLYPVKSALSFFFAYFVLLFIPLYIAAPYSFLFYTILFLYIGFFIYINHFKMNYHWTETLAFIAFFMFVAIVMKGLINYHVVDEKEVVKTAIIYGNFE